MTDQELSAHILSEAESNPTLDMDRLHAEGSPINFREKAEWLYQKRRGERNAPVYDDDDGGYDRVMPSEDIQDSPKWLLLSQLPADELGGKSGRIYNFLIESMDERGYLDIDEADVSKFIGVPPNEVRRCITELRSLQPAGICARDLKDCLLAQISLRPTEKTAKAIIEDYLKELARGHYSLIAKKLGITTAEVHKAAAIIKELSPAPADELCAKERGAEYLMPDAVVSSVNGRAEVTLCRSYIPFLAVNPYYLKLYGETDDESVRLYLDERFKAAQNLIKNVGRREETFLRCVGIIADIQKEYFADRSAALAPMTLENVAERAGVHMSTVSRAIRSRYIQSDRGVIALRDLFTRRLDSSREEDCSVDAAKKLISYFVDSESKTAPLSDQRLSELLAVKGVDISRRTVAKYREQLGIASTHARKLR